MTKKISQNFSQGSEWRKWDLHVHTPSSLVQHYGGDTDVIWEKYLSDLEGLSKEFSVLGVNDYLFLDGYERLKKEKELNNRIPNIDLLLPVVEFRIEKFAGVNFGNLKRINLHVIFSNELPVETIKSQFLNTLEQSYKLNSGGDWTRAITRESIEELGKEIKKGIPKEELKKFGSDLEEGFNNINVDEKQIFKSLEKDCFKGKYIIAVGKTEWDSLSWTDSSIATKKSIINSADIVFTASESVDIFNKAKESLKAQNVNNLLLDCSDAHNFSVSKNKDRIGNCNNWIKADPTFEGLKQVIYDNEERLRVQELRPEEKSDYSVIERIEYTNHDGKKQVVYFNQNLNSIIGSRAQGKSNLLKNIAYAVDSKQCELRGIETDNFLHLNAFRVFWVDGKENTLDENETKEKGILFIPQKYLGELIYDEDPKLDSFLINLFENKEDFRKALEDYRRFEDSNILKITSGVREMLTIKNTGVDKSEKLKKLGKKEDYEKEIKEIDAKIKKFGKTASITPAELKSYEKFNLEKTTKEKEFKTLNQDINSFEELKKEDVISSEYISELQFSKVSRDKIRQKLSDTDEAFKKDFIDEEMKVLRARSAVVVKEIAVLEAKAKPLQEKINKSKTLIDLTNLLEKKKEVGKQIEEIGKELIELRKVFAEKKKEIIIIYQEFENQYQNLKIDLGELNFSQVKILVTFDTNSFRKMTDEYINYHNSTVFRKNDSGLYTSANAFLGDPAQWSYAKTSFSLLLKEILDGMLSGNLLLKSNKDIEATLLELLRNRYKIDFLQSVTNKKGIQFPDMSAGEQMLALLEFIFKFDDYNYPVLLDQPEDDLDSRAISTTIVNFIKTEKKERQIIVASHNANLVVCGDSEEIIISEKEGNKNPAFKYTTGAIENPIINKEIVEVLEGGKDALKKRMKKLNALADK